MRPNVRYCAPVVLDDAATETRSASIDEFTVRIPDGEAIRRLPDSFDVPGGSRNRGTSA
ncbi:hypothetical protein Rruber_03739 [Rhodococcus ruber]